MADFIGNYYQHIIDILVNDGFSYGDICDMYNLHESDEVVTVLAVQRAHRDETRGNLPTSKNAFECYDQLICGFYMTLEQRKDFARRLHMVLTRDGMFPHEWEKQMELITGFSDQFDPEIFGSYIIDLLKKDEESKKKNKKNKLSTLKKNEIALQREGVKQAVKEKPMGELSPLAFSRRFFTEGARSIVDLDEGPFNHELSRLSDVFENITTLEFKCNPEDFSCDENLFVTLTEWVRFCLQASGSKEILKVKGPLGSYKNRLMQYLYLAIERKLDFVAPIYIDIASYEKAAEGNDGIDENDFLRAFEVDIQRAEKIVAAAPGKIPLLILDGVRDFTCRNESLYYSLNERLQKTDWYFVVCMDTDFTINNQNKYDVHPLVSNGYACYLRIRSMNLNRKQESIDFIRNCVDVFKVSLPSDVSVEQIYDNLVRLNFLTLDAYWLTYILHSNLKDVLNQKNNISGLYNAICVSFLGSHKLVESASEFAFEFEFGKRNFNNANPYFDLRWRLIRKHRSVLDFLIAKFYIKKVSELNLERGSREQNVEKLGFFNMVLQKTITRFVVTMLKGIDDYERQIMIIATRYYDELALFGKSELTFWMARLQNPVRKKECVKLLKSYNEKELARYREDNFPSLEEKRKAAFLLRGINVSLIYENDKKALAYYLESLVKDKIANSVNRGFHLEYYGDKPYIPNKALLDFEDDITSGESTFTVLCLSLDRRIPSPVAVLEVMTLCSLIQARLEHADQPGVMDVEPYIDKCLQYVDWILKQRALKGLDVARNYLCWMHKELQAYKATGKAAYHPSCVFNKFTDAAYVNRTGWVELNVPRPENIVEHMYNCWLLGMLYLPNACDDPEYSKDRILQMLLLHDLGETETGDISRPVKRSNPHYYDQQENAVMEGLFLSGTYPGSVDLSPYMQHWDTWAERAGINYQLAKDLDNIQTIYQFCKYDLRDPQLFSDEHIAYWLNGLDEIETDIGKEIADTLIINNPLFHTILERYNVDDEM